MNALQIAEKMYLAVAYILVFAYIYLAVGKFEFVKVCSVYNFLKTELEEIDKLESVRCSGRVKIYRTEAVVMVAVIAAVLIARCGNRD